MRPASLPLPHPFMEFLHRHSELFGLSADFVQRDQAVIPVECRILDAFRRDRARRLLKFHDEADLLVLVCLRTGFALLQENRTDEIKHLTADGGIPSLRTRHGHMNVGAITVGDGFRPFGHIRPIDRETGDDFPNCMREIVQRKVPRAPVPFRNQVELVAQHVDLTRHRDPHDQLLAGVHQIGIDSSRSVILV